LKNVSANGDSVTLEFILRQLSFLFVVSYGGGG